MGIGSQDLLWALPLLMIALAFVWMRRRRPGLRSRLPDASDNPENAEPVGPKELRRARRLFLLTALALVVVIVVSVLSTLQQR